MAFIPRPVSPRSAGSDLWKYLAEKRQHKWPLLGVSAAMTYLIIWAFVVDAKDISQPQRNKITYFKSWNTDRADAQAILQQKLDVADYEISVRKKQQEMQKLADRFGIEWREEAAKNDARREVALKKLKADLDKRLAEAEKEEGAAAAHTGLPAPIVRLPATRHETPASDTLAPATKDGQKPHAANKPASPTQP